MAALSAIFLWFSRETLTLPLTKMLLNQ